MPTEKDIQREIAMLIGEITTLAYMVNTNTQYCVFVRFAGHVNWIEISIRESQEEYKTELVNETTYLDPSPKVVCKRLAEIKTELRKILRKNRIDYSRLGYEIEEVRHYKLRKANCL
ncbi:hypothetical protein ABEX47_03215 [Paenibacillus ehimensis]|uniref:hypothetical protein n=1 Tax=Paenibacillus ehimensis TaxID=79264 RepID=UPI003D2D5711